MTTEKKPFFILAPMDDVTDTVFRRIIHDIAPADLYMTEFVNVDGLCSQGREKLLPRLSTVNDKGELYAQLWGKIPANFETIAFEISNRLLGDTNYENWIAKEIKSNISKKTEISIINLAKEYLTVNKNANNSKKSNNQTVLNNGYKFSGIDLNFGCPDKAVLKNQCCSALAQPELRDKAVAIIKATQKGAGNMPVSVKTRLGFDKIDYSWHKLLLKQNLSILSVHVRTTRQMSKVPADWPAIDEIVRLRDEISPTTKIVLNGDINDRQQGETLAKKHKVDGIMIGRGIFHNPLAFAESSKVRPWKEVPKEEKLDLLKKHIKLHAKTWPNNERKYHPLKKFVKIYISDFSGASELRDKFMQTENRQQALDLVNELDLN